MKTIWKYDLDITDSQNIIAKEGAKFLAVQYQGHYPVVWAEVDTENPDGYYTIEVFGTGNPIPDHNRRYIGTVQDNIFVWHVFVREPEELDPNIIEAVLVYEQ